MNKKQFLSIMLLSTAFVSFAGGGENSLVEKKIREEENRKEIEKRVEEAEKIMKDCSFPTELENADFITKARYEARYLKRQKAGINTAGAWLFDKYECLGMSSNTISGILKEARFVS